MGGHYNIRRWWMLNVSFWWVSITDWLWLNALWPGELSPEEKWDEKFKPLEKK